MRRCHVLARTGLQEISEDRSTFPNLVIQYAVEPRLAGPVKTRLIRKMLERLNAEPEKVLFPKSDAR